MAAMYYWDGAQWLPIATGGGTSTPGPQGPPGESVNVFVQPTTPTPQRPGDFWIDETPAISKTYPTFDDLKGQ